MSSTTAYAGECPEVRLAGVALRSRIYESICRLSEWLVLNDYRAYDTFDGLSARFLRPLTFNRRFLRTILQQGVRRFPINLRPLLNKTPTLHWGQATMLSALAGLYQQLYGGGTLS